MDENTGGSGRRWVFALVVLLACLTWAPAQAAGDLVAVLAGQPPTIDGDLADPVWSAARPVSAFTLARSRTRAPKQTSVRAAFDGEALYLGIVCAEPQMSRIQAARRARDADTWEDDCVEVFLSPRQRGDESLQLLANPLESIADFRYVSDGKGRPADWNPGWQVRVRRDPQAWQAEARIPFRELGVPAPVRGETWGLKLGREDHTYFPRPNERGVQLYTWPAGTGYGRTAGQGTLVFEDRNCLRNAGFRGAGEPKLDDWSVTGGDVKSLEGITTDAAPTLRLRAPATGRMTLGQGMRLQPNATYRLSVEARGSVEAYVQVNTERPGKHSPSMAIRIPPSGAFRAYSLEFPSGPVGRAGVTLGNLGSGGKAPEVLLRRLRVEATAGSALPDYMQWKRVEPDPIHRLSAFMERHGYKPYERLRDLGLAGCERLAFRDTVTGTEIWKLTNDSTQEGHDYALWPPYSADGAHLWFRSTRWIDGETRATTCVMGSTGDGIRLLTPWYNLSGWWHPRDGDTYFYLFQLDDHYELTAINVRTMQRRVLANLPPLMGILIAEPGPWSDWLLLVYPDGLAGELVKMDGSARNKVTFPVKLQGRVDFSRAHKGVFFNGNRALRITPDGHLDPGFLIEDVSQTKYRHARTLVNHGQPSPDERFTARPDGSLTLPDGTQRQLIQTHYLLDYDSFIGNNGYVSWRSTPEWLLLNNGPQVVKLWADGSNVQNICFFNTLSTTYYTMPWAASSPDGTKLVYRSMMTGSVEFYQAIISKPLPPRGLAARARGKSVELAWQPPETHREIAGYLVYRSAESGRGYRQLTPRPVAATRFVDRDAAGGRACYVVSAVEHSGLESAYSAEACAAPPPGPIRHFSEAEFAALQQPVVLRRSPRDASNLHYVSASDYLAGRQGRRGSASFTFQVPRAGAYRLLGRVRVKEGARQATAGVALDAQPVGEWRIGAARWAWRVFPAKLPLDPGRHELRWAPQDSAFELDGICLTDDPAFTPAGPGLGDMVPPEPPRGLRATASGPFAVALSWAPDRSPDCAYYNVYASRERGFTPSQASRVGSVYKPAFLDWGLKPGQAYAYRVAAVDRAGNEGRPSAVVVARPEAIPVARLALEAEAGEVSGQARVGEDAEAAGRRAVSVPELGTTGEYPSLVPGKATGGLVLSCDVPEDGTYMVWGRFRSIWREADLSLTVDGDSATTQRWPITFGYHHEKAYMIWGRGASTSYVYCWCEARTNSCPDPRPFLFKLKKGSHRIALQGLPEGLSVDQLVLTSDLSWLPDGTRNYY